MIKSRHDSGKNRWVLLFAVLLLAGILVTTGCVSQQPTSQTPTPSATLTQVPGGTAFPTVKPTTPVIIPATGVFVKVSYIGGFNGTYGVNDVTQKVRNSGDRLYPIENATGTVIATFYKEDRSSHALTAEVWKDGKMLTSAANSTAFGKVSVTYQV